MDDLAGIYNRRFYEVTTPGSIKAAEAAFAKLSEYLSIDRIVDVGCGVGTWLRVAQTRGARVIVGLEGEHVPDDILEIPPHFVRRLDLSSPLEMNERFDLCLCLEVAEHLPPERAESLVHDLVRLSHVVAFSAAIPYQGGNGHINEMWPEAWASLFSRHDYIPWNGLRKHLWKMRDVPWWYRQNLILFVHDPVFRTLFSREVPADVEMLTWIHPESYLWDVRRLPVQLRHSYRVDVDTYYACASGINPPTVSYGSEFSILAT